MHLACHKYTKIDIYQHGKKCFERAYDYGAKWPVTKLQRSKKYINFNGSLRFVVSTYTCVQFHPDHFTISGFEIVNVTHFKLNLLAKKFNHGNFWKLVGCW